MEFYTVTIDNTDLEEVYRVRHNFALLFMIYLHPQITNDQSVHAAVLEFNKSIL